MKNDNSKIHGNKGSKPLGRPTHNPDYVLTNDQIAFIVAILLTDGWISLGKGYRNPSIGLQLAKRSESLVQVFMDTLKAKSC